MVASRLLVERVTAAALSGVAGTAMALARVGRREEVCPGACQAIGIGLALARPKGPMAARSPGAGEECVVSSILLRRLVAADSRASAGCERLSALWHAVRSRFSSNRRLAWCVNACAVVVALLASRDARACVTQGILSVIILGSVFVVPLACVLTIIGVLSPEHTPLRETSGQLFGFGLLWFVVAIFGAHLQSQGREGA
jgi:hypothetical protein